MREELRDSIVPALELPWILEIDTAVKPLYGHRQGAEISYNPSKPGRPSHIYHSYFVSNLRISLGVEVMPGKRHAAAEGMPGLWQTLDDDLPRSRWPTFARGDCGYGSEKIMCEFEALLRRVQRHVQFRIPNLSMRRELFAPQPPSG